MDIIGDKESDAVSEKTIALTKQKHPLVTSTSPTQRAIDQEPEQPIPTTLPHKPLIHCPTVNHNNFNSSSHTDNMSEGFTGVSEIETTWEREERSSNLREI